MRQLETAPHAPEAALCTELAGYTIVERVGECPVHETWRVQAPDGRLRLLQRIKYIDQGQVRLALERLRTLPHPHLLPAQYLHADSGQLLVLFEEGFVSLQERYQQCRANGLPGIPQLELVGYTRAVAETLDQLHGETGLMHLTLNPRNLFLRERQVFIADFGLAQMCWLPDRYPLYKLNPRYSAPELWHGKLTRRADQCSLALIHAEMLTGAHPAPHLGNLRSPERRWQLDLHLLSTTDQALIGQALALAAPDRFGSCTELARRLEEAALRSHGLAQPLVVSLPPVLFTPRLLRSMNQQPDEPSVEEFLARLSEFTVNYSQQRQFEDVRYLLKPGVALEHRCLVPLGLDEAMTALETACQEWRLRAARVNERTFLLEMTQSSLWGRLIGKRQGIEVQLNFHPVRLSEHATMQDLGIQVRPLGCSGDQTVLLERLGPPLLVRLRQALGAVPELRTAERLQWKQPLQVTPVGTNHELQLPIHCLGKDISLGGVGFFSRDRVPSRDVYINLPWLPGCQEVSVRAHVVRGRRGENGWYELGASFRVGGLPSDDKVTR